MRRLLIALIVVTLATPLAQGDSPVDETRSTLRAHVVKLINKDRQLYGLPPVELDALASKIGDEYCREQIRNKTTGHFTTDGMPPYARYSQAGGNDGVSENAAAWSANYKFTDRALYEMARRSEDAMMAELPPNDGHKKVILDPHATHVGVGLAWEGGEFRLVHEFIRRYVSWSRPVARRATTADLLTGRGRTIGEAKIAAISVHFEETPQAMPAHVASSIRTYTLPQKRNDYFPRLRDEIRRHKNGSVDMITRRYEHGGSGDFALENDGTFSFSLPVAHGPGLYTVAVWVRRPGFTNPFIATNVSVRVEAAPELSAGTR